MPVWIAASSDRSVAQSRHIQPSTSSAITNPLRVRCRCCGRGGAVSWARCSLMCAPPVIECVFQLGERAHRDALTPAIIDRHIAAALARGRSGRFPAQAVVVLADNGLTVSGDAAHASVGLWAKLPRFVAVAAAGLGIAAATTAGARGEHLGDVEPGDDAVADPVGALIGLDRPI